MSDSVSVCLENYKTKQKIKPRIVAYCDSHGRNLNNGLEGRLQNKFDVTVIFKPNAKFETVTKISNVTQASLAKSDYVVVWAGTNNFPDYFDQIKNSAESLLKKLVKTNVIILGIPFRFDLPELNDQISKVNAGLYELTKQFDFATFVSLNTNHRRFFNRGGLHLNRVGMRLTANLIVDSVLGENVKPITSPQVGSSKSRSDEMTSSHSSRVNLSKTYFSSHLGVKSNQTIDQKKQVWINPSFRDNFLLESLTRQRIT